MGEFLKMKKWITVLSIFLLGVTLGANNLGGIADDDFRQALYKAIDSAAPSLKAAKFGKRSIAVLPMKGDKMNLLPERLRNMLTQMGFVCVVGKEETETLNRIYSEIANSERKDDIMDPATVVKFGKLKNTQLLFSCRILTLSQDSNRIFVELDMNVMEIATGKRVWGGTFACRHYSGKDVRGIVTMDTTLRTLLKKHLASLKTSLTSAGANAKLAKIKNIVVIPVSGDIDRYITGMVIESLSETHFLPEYTDIQTVSQFRYAVKDGSAKTKTVLYGAVRDLHVTNPAKSIAADGKHFALSQQINGEIQLFIEDAGTGTILWSKNINFSEQQTEMQVIPSDPQKYIWIACGVIAALVVLFVMFLIIVKLFAARNNIR